MIIHHNVNIDHTCRNWTKDLVLKKSYKHEVHGQFCYPTNSSMKVVLALGVLILALSSWEVEANKLKILQMNINHIKNLMANYKQRA